jgi:predicted ArsR family transcriptional regulator
VTLPSMTTAQARALGAPMRQAMMAFLADANRPATVAELTAHLGVNHNAVRKHLAQLVAAGLVVAERETRTAPGRPKFLYRLAPHAVAPNETAYERLAVLLATALASGEDPRVIGRRSEVRATPPWTALGSPGSPVDELAARLAFDGFDPSVHRRGRRTDIVLGRCPFAAAATANPEAVCRLHLGLAEGSADAIGGLRVERLAAKDPRRAGCRLTVTETT